MIRVLASLGNPIQIISRYRVPRKVLTQIGEIAAERPRQILFSTSITSFSHSKFLEPGASPPLERLAMLSDATAEGIPTNLMIKPFLPGVTDADAETFRAKLEHHGVPYCTVGVFYHNRKIIRSLSMIGHALLNRNDANAHPLVCRPQSTYQTSVNRPLLEFCSVLRSPDTRVFLNSACVSAVIANQLHVSRLQEVDPLGLCVRCGHCQAVEARTRLQFPDQPRNKRPAMTDDLIKLTENYVRNELYGEGSGHDWWHVFRVWKLAQRIGEEEGADMLTVSLSALLHDIADWKDNNGDFAIGPRIAAEWLRQNGASPELLENVEHVLQNVSFKGIADEKKHLSLECRVVQDADRLDATGAMGIARTFAYGGAKGRAMYDPDIPPIDHKSVDSYVNNRSPSINHFYEKLLLLRDLMHTETARKIAAHRHQFMEEFLQEFYAEWEGRL